MTIYITKKTKTYPYYILQWVSGDNVYTDRFRTIKELKEYTAAWAVTKTEFLERSV